MIGSLTRVALEVLGMRTGKNMNARLCRNRMHACVMPVAVQLWHSHWHACLCLCVM